MQRLGGVVVVDGGGGWRGKGFKRVQQEGRKMWKWLKAKPK